MFARGHACESVIFKAKAVTGFKRYLSLRKPMFNAHVIPES